MAVNLIQMPCELGISIYLGLTDSLSGSLRAHSIFGANPPWALLDLSDFCLLSFCLWCDEAACRAVSDLTTGCSGESLFLARFSGAAENTGDDLDAAETEGKLAVFEVCHATCLTCRRLPE